MKSTDYFRNRIKDSKDITEFTDEIVSTFVDAKKMLNNEIIKAGLNASKIGATLGKSNYIYEITSYGNKKKPSRDLLIAVLVCCKSEVAIIDEILQKFSYSKLYAKVLRDALIIYAIENKYDIHQTNELLSQQNQKALI